MQIVNAKCIPISLIKQFLDLFKKCNCFWIFPINVNNVVCVFVQFNLS